MAVPLIAGALRALPYVSAAAAGLPPLLEGRPLEALASGGLAYAGGRLLGGPALSGMTVPGTGGRSVERMSRIAGRKLGIDPATLLGVGAIGLGLGVPALAQNLGAGTVRAAGSILNPAASTAAAFGVVFRADQPHTI